MLSPSRMARRVALIRDLQLRLELQAVDVPTLVVTGDASLDRVVPVRLTREYLDIWPHARHATIARTGHLGLITRAAEFAGVVAPFAADSERTGDPRRRVG
jgi:pimeloyl-ACP methyl ester carboxylesterase